MAKKAPKAKAKPKKAMSQEELTELLKKSLKDSESIQSEEELNADSEDVDVTGLDFHPLLKAADSKAPVLEQIASGAQASPIFVARARAGNVDEDSEVKYGSAGKEDSKYSAGHEYESPNIKETPSARDFNFSEKREVSMDTSLAPESRRDRWAAEETFSPERVRNQTVSPFEAQSQEKKYKEPKHKKL